MATAISTAPTAVAIQPRVPNTTICLPICYGSIAFPLVKPEEYNTHRWTIYVRGPNNEDLSHGIAKVVFQLHPSFPQPVREVTAPPFEVTEKGWGEFEVSIRIVWRDASEKALVFSHMLKLYPPLETTAASSGSNVKKELEDGVGAGGNVEDGKNEIQVEGEVKLDPVKSEVYDEVVFTDPTETFHRQLTQATMFGTIPLVTSQEPAAQKYFLPYSDEDDFKCLLEAQKFLENELMVVKDRILRADCAANELDAAMMEVLAKAKSIPVPPPAAAASSSSSAAPASASTGTKRKKPSGGGGGGSKKKKTVPSTSSNTPKSTAAVPAPPPTTTTAAAAPTPAPTTTTAAVSTPAPTSETPTASSSKPTTE